jgi:ubiquinone/menaquinone biosynthesis C-methylase UbiE
MPEDECLTAHIEQHYAQVDLGGKILSALKQAGKDIEDLRPEDLAPVDEFHIRGREATLELGAMAGLKPAMHVLDVGSGIGGPSRCLASEYGCRVVGIDLMDEYCRAASMLADRVGLSHLVTYRQGNALELPFPDDAFDVVWSQHTAMNIPDKAALYCEMGRVLKPGGTLAIYDVLAGPNSPIHYPVVWARTPEVSFLVSPDEMRRYLMENGFLVADWQDSTDSALSVFTKFARRIQEKGLPPLGTHILLGSDFAAMVLNQWRNLQEGRIVLAQVVATKAA